jgi:hypothetical protein
MKNTHPCQSTIRRSHRGLQKAALSLAFGAGLSCAQAQETSSQLWDAYVKAPNTNPNIPNNSFAGYHRGEAPIPQVPVVANVMDLGAKGDGTADDTAAFQSALAAAGKKGGAILVPAGTYKVTGVLNLSNNGVVLRGEGPDKTTIEFQKSLTDSISPLSLSGSSQWSWCGGLIWIGPADTFDASGKVVNGETSGVNGWEYWHAGDVIAEASGPAQRGDFTVPVTSTSGLKPGAMVLMTWENIADQSLLKAIAGHPLMDTFQWDSATWILQQSYPRWQWPVQIKDVQGSSVTLVQPLRVDIRPEWKVAFRDLGTSVQEDGIENLKLKLHAPMTHKHLQCVGWNGIYINRAYNCWVKNVQIESAENPIILASAKNVTVDGLSITGPEQNHHSIACRVNSHDNLIENFVIDGPMRVKHGINIEWLSSGNVYSKGRMMKGTFDSHRALSFDLIRTEITLRNDADGPGGADEAGPFLGAHVVHWNIDIENSPRKDPGEFVNMPEALPMGALVGVRGAPISTKAAPAMPKGDKGTVIADEGQVPTPPNLYEAELKLRLGQ